jgi:hypothetical protein
MLEVKNSQASSKIMYGINTGMVSFFSEIVLTDEQVWRISEK